MRWRGSWKSSPGRALRLAVDCRSDRGHAVLMDRRVALTRASVQRLLRTLRTALDEMYGDDLVAIRLFGSYARRQATPDSDVDILLVLREVDDYGTEVRRVSDLFSRLSMECGKTIAPVFVDAARFASGSDPFMAAVASEALPA